jgi:hypothetical protein
MVKQWNKGRHGKIRYCLPPLASSLRCFTISSRPYRRADLTDVSRLEMKHLMTAQKSIRGHFKVNKMPRNENISYYQVHNGGRERNGPFFLIGTWQFSKVATGKGDTSK